MDWKRFWYMFLTNKEIFFEFIPLLDSGIFGDPVMTNLLIIVQKYFDKYKKQPEIDVLYMFLDTLPKKEQDHKQKYIDFLDSIQKIKVNVSIDVMKEKITQKIQDYEMERFILRSIRKIEVGEVSFEDLLGDIRSIVNKYRPVSLGVDVTDAERVVELIRHDVVEKVTSGIPQLDNLTYGGYGNNEISIMVAPPGRGKSFFLVNAMYGAMLAGKNALYVTCELAEKSVLKRLYGRIAYANRKQMKEETFIIKSANKFFTLSKAMGKVVYFPSKSLTVEGLEAYIEKQELYFDFRPDIIIVDYLDLLAPRKVDYGSDPRHRLRNITDDLRSIALRRDIAIVTATQANRASLSLNKITEANIAESFGKVEVADIVLAICSTEEERAANRARIVVLKNRDYVSGGCIEMYVDFERMLLLDLDTAGRLGIISREHSRPECSELEQTTSETMVQGSVNVD